MKKNLMLLLACMLSLQVFSQNLYPNDELIVMLDNNIDPVYLQTLLDGWDMSIVDGPTSNMNAVLLKLNTQPQSGNNPFGPINGIKEEANTENEVTGVGFNLALATNGMDMIETISQDDDPCYDILDPNSQPNGGNNITTAIFDTGLGQFQMSGNNFIDPNNFGHNYINPSIPPRDDNSHGSHITSIVMNNLENNNAAIQLKSYKTHDSTGQGELWNVIKAIDRAITDQVQIINMSFSYYIDQDHSTELKSALRMAIRAAKNSAGILCIAAAGNDNNDNDFTNNLNGMSAYPASFDEPNIISVASADCALNKSYFSNYGSSSVDVFAPGEDILGYNRYGQVVLMSGTSQATAFVTKLATYLGTHQQFFSWELTKCAILNGVVAVAPGGFVLTDGYINSVNSLIALQNGTDCSSNPANRQIEDKNAEDNSLTVTPYFNQSRINISSTRNFEAEVYITATNGQVLFKKMITITKGNLDYIFDFQPPKEMGVYFLTVSDKNRVNTFKFIH